MIMSLFDCITHVHDRAHYAHFIKSFTLIAVGSPYLVALQAGMREAHLRDAEALCDFFAFLEDTIGAGGKLTEVQVGRRWRRVAREQRCGRPWLGRFDGGIV
jgi:hypothetical protein